MTPSLVLEHYKLVGIRASQIRFGPANRVGSEKGRHITSLKDLFDFSYIGCSSLNSMHLRLLGCGEMFTVLMKFILVW